ncbi:MAG: Fic family protein, partial [Sphaerochaetaceae bacterium]|nr:Fic family protein [Sphaerochaetaceae bacterium]
MDKYVPPFTATEEIEELLLDVLKKARLFVKNNQLSKNPVLRKSSRIKTIYSSCKIENNSLSLFDTTALLEGKVVSGPMQDIDEILNANEAYKHLEEYNPYS